MNADLCRESLATTIESAENLARCVGYELPKLPVASLDQFAATIRDDFRSVGLDPSKRETLYAAAGGVMALMAMWQGIDCAVTLAHVNAYAQLCRTLCEMADALN